MTRVDIRVCADDSLRALNLIDRCFLPDLIEHDPRPPASGPEHELRIHLEGLTEQEVRELLEPYGIFVLASRTRPLPDLKPPVGKRQPKSPAQRSGAHKQDLDRSD